LTNDVGGFKVSGLAAKLPLFIDVDDGPYSLIKDYKSLAKQNLKCLLLTAPGEKVMDPGFGAGLREYLFEQKDSLLTSRIKARITQQVEKYLPYITITDINFGDTGTEDNKLDIEVRYIIQGLSVTDLLTINAEIN
tara:strand:- start:735 stop:1142 length:408 start_codon:yes stop_codon:yes gene_type:complete